MGILHLNQEQSQAVHHQSGPLLVVAGAGSGKTRVITARIIDLISIQKIPSSAIIALTFTNKAAKEMKERISLYLQESRELPFIGTFHSYCVRLLKKYNHLLETPFSAVLDEDDQHAIIQGIITRNGLNKKITAKQISYQISHAKNHSLSPEKDEQFIYNPLLADIYRAYEHEKLVSKCFDFDDLLLQAAWLFKKNDVFRQQFQSIHRHILVDEYQDTNVVQHELLKLMTLNNTGDFALDSLCAVGDEDQSIYSWRGATVTNIMNFSKDFKNTHIVKIEQNYRSVQPILDVANELIQYNTTRNPKRLWSEKNGNDRIRMVTCMSEYQEADVIVQFLKSSTGLQKRRDIAILYRAHYQSRAIEEALIKHSIPYTIIGGVQFYERKEVKDLLGYLKLIANPYDRVSLLRVLNSPTRGLGDATQELIISYWNNEQLLPFNDLLQWIIEQKLVTPNKQESLKKFIKTFDTLCPQELPSKTLNQIIERINYYSFLKESCTPEEAATRTDNVKELLRAIEHLETQGTSTVTQFLEEVTLMQTALKAEDEESDRVLMMTLHAAKGLEFNTVIICGLEEGLLPSSRSLANPESIEEERRLLYVGITRAQERLLLTFSRYRYSFGSMSTQQASRFINEIPLTIAPLHDYSSYSSYEIARYFAQWFGKQPSSTQVITFSKPKNISIEDVKKEAIQKPQWKKHQPVSHEKFGVGIIQDIELRAHTNTILTIQFKSDIKKIDARFVTNI